MLVDTPVTMGLFGWLDPAKTVPQGYTAGSFFWIINNIYFQYFSVLITIVSAIVMVVVSYMTQGAGLREDKEFDLRHRDGGRPSQNASKLGLARCYGLGLYPAVHSLCLSVLQGII